MAHYPKPFFKKGRGVWYVEIDRKQINLGPDQDEAFRRYHEIMAKPKPVKVDPNAVLGVLDSFLDWCSKHRAPDTFRWYKDRLQDFAVTIDRSLTVDRFRPHHVQQWVDSHEAWSDGSRRNGIRAVKRAFKWAEEQGHIDRSPIAHMKKPKGGKREVLISQTEYDEILGQSKDRGFRDLLIVTWETGCRPQESLIVEARHVDLVNQRWVFQQSEEKNREAIRVVYLTDPALEIVRRLMLVHPEGPLFRNSRGEPWTADSVNCVFARIRVRIGMTMLKAKTKVTDGRRKIVQVDEREAKELVANMKRGVRGGKPLSDARMLHEARKRLAKKTALKVAPKYSLYALRHTWMNRLLTSGVDALTVAILAGHKDPSTLAKYYQHLSMNPQHLLQQAKRAAG